MFRAILLSLLALGILGLSGCHSHAHSGGCVGCAQGR